VLLLSDTDFLSSFLKIGQLETVRDFYRTDHRLITPGIYQELARTDLITTLDSLVWVTIRSVSAAALAGYRNAAGFARLGRGEQETIALAGCLKAAVLMRDHRALQYARGRRISCG
jgi:predicted nucleic acid-binding protein